MPYQVTLEKKHHLNQSGLEAGLPASKSCPCTRGPPSGGRRPPRPSRQLHRASRQGSVSGAAIQPSLHGSEAAICRLFAATKSLSASLKAGVQEGRAPHAKRHTTPKLRGTPSYHQPGVTAGKQLRESYIQKEMNCSQRSDTPTAAPSSAIRQQPLPKGQGLRGEDAWVLRARSQREQQGCCTQHPLHYTALRLPLPL